MRKIDLCGKWKCYNDKTGPFEGIVPGCVTSDLIKEGRVYGEKEPATYGKEDGIFYRDNAKKIQWIENENFIYEKNFTVKPNEDGTLPKNAVLVFECLDTYANIYLNGLLMAQTDDMHIIYRFNVDKYLKKGKNTLKIEFESPVKKVEGLPLEPAAFTAERLNTRRIQCTYGWDWVYRFVTCGIERPCYIQFEENMAVEHAYIYTVSADKTQAAVNAVVKLKNYEKKGYVTTEVIAPSGKTVYRTRRFVAEEYFTEYIDIANPELWYPLGYGKQPLYTVRFTVTDEKGENTEIHTEKTGIRTVRLLQLPDEEGSEAYEKCKMLQNTPSGKQVDINDTYSCFTLLVNGIKIFCKGGNWVPCDPLISEESDGKITRLLEMARAGGFNMLRIWGGGVFEKDHFYSECDRLGIMVTQDFLMACGKYPEEKAYFLDQVGREAECVALRLRNHPCLMWWSGDNENAVNGYEELPWFTGRDVALKAIAPALRKYDYNRHFLPSSPYGGKKYASKTKGTTHNTNFVGDMFVYMLNSPVDNYKDDYKEYLARFIAEEPSIGAVAPTTLHEFMTDEDIYDNDTLWNFHTQSNPAISETIWTHEVAFAEKLFGKYENGRDRLFKTRYLQCEWSRVSMEMVRRNMFFSSGIVYWMFNDCWPASSGWAFVDYYCRPKDSYYCFLCNTKPFISSIDKENGTLSIWFSNIGKTLKNLTGTLKTVNFKTGKISSTETFYADSPENKSVNVFTVKQAPAADEILVLDVTDKSGKMLHRTFYKNGKLDMGKTDCLKITEKTASSVTVTATGFVQSVFLDGDFVFSDDCFILLPGETKTVTFKPCKTFGRDVSAHSDNLEITGYGLI